MPKFYLRSSNGQYEHEVVDGQQRLHAIWEFLNDEYALGEDSTDILGFGDLVGKKWSQLSSPARDQIGEFELSIALVEEAKDLEIRQLFLRLQEGISLTPPEKRNAMPGNMRDFVADLAENHRIFQSELTSLPDMRFQRHDFVAIVTRLEITAGPTDVKALSLKKMYEDEQEFNYNGTTANKIKRHLHYMARVLEPEESTPEMDIKWGFVDLYLLISKIDESYAISRRERDFKSFYIAFERERRENMGDYGALRTGENHWDGDLYDYIEAFIRSGGTKPNLEKRHEVYKRRFLRDIQDLVPRDPQRAFSRNERIVIWRRDGETCQECNEIITFDEMQADHITPYADGGETTLDNAQTLCRECNARKGAN